jgi:hypothetical protein
MRKMVLSTVIAIAFGAVTAFAQTSGGTMGGGTGGMQHEGMGSQGMMQGGMMSPEMMTDMSGVMNHMMEMMQMMSHTMGHRTVTEHMQMSEMAGMMEEMSGMMHTLSQHMAKGEMGPADTKKMQGQLELMKKKMEAMGKEGK